MRKWAFIHFLCIFIFAVVLSSTADVNGDVEKGIRLFEENKIKEAKTFFESFVENNPKSPVANYYLGRIHYRENNYDDAVERLSQAVDLEKDNADYHYWLGRAYGEKAQKANIFKKAFLAGKTKSAFEKAVALDPDHVDGRWGLVRYYVMAPGIMGGSIEEAKKQAQEIKKRDVLEGHSAFGYIYRHEEEYDKEEQEYHAAIEAKPGEMTGYYMLGGFYRRAKKYDESVAVYEKMLLIKPDETDAYYQIGFTYQNAQKYDKAFETFEKLIEMKPEEMGAYYQVGRTGAFSGMNLDRAAECLKLYLKHEPDANEPSLAWTHYRLGMVYEKKGEKELAKQEYKTTLKLEPDHEQAKKALKNL